MLHYSSVTGSLLRFQSHTPSRLIQVEWEYETNPFKGALFVFENLHDSTHIYCRRELWITTCTDMYEEYVAIYNWFLSIYYNNQLTHVFWERRIWLATHLLLLFDMKWFNLNSTSQFSDKRTFILNCFKLGWLVLYLLARRWMCPANDSVLKIESESC